MRITPEHTQWLQSLKAGDEITRYLSSAMIPMPMVVTGIDDLIRVTGANNSTPGAEWTFHKDTGAEVDEDLGWNGVNRTGSFIQKEAPK